jgi:hypothetical protein
LYNMSSHNTASTDTPDEEGWAYSDLPYEGPEAEQSTSTLRLKATASSQRDHNAEITSVETFDSTSAASGRNPAATKVGSMTTAGRDTEASDAGSKLDDDEEWEIIPRRETGSSKSRAK